MGIIRRSIVTNSVTVPYAPTGNQAMLDRDFSRPGRSLAVAENGMAATSHPQASLAALDILRAGGNAVDAAICAVAVQSVVEPHMTGIGGDCFAIYSPAGSAPVCLNGSGRAPAAATLEHYLERGQTAIADDSVDAVTVPGAIDAWCRLLERHGRLGIDRVLSPAIDAAENGFRITPRVAHDWTVDMPRIAHYPDAAAHYLPNGVPPRTGDRMRHPALAETLRRIARDGAKAFYEGEVAADMVARLRQLGGLHTEEDFATTESTFGAPISARYRDHDLLECPPNGQGLAALIIARVLDGFDLSDAGLTEADRIHLLVEATKAGYAARDRFIADPDYMDMAVEDMLSDRTVAAIRAHIDPLKAREAYRWEGPEHRDTVYVSVVDRDRNVVSLINSLFYSFGSGIYAPKTGVLFQNRGTGFRVEPGHPNAIAPRKRPFHTIIPGMLSEAGRTRMAFGVMGGHYQAVGHAHFISQMLDRGFDPQMASDAPRSLFLDGTLWLEPTISEETRRTLERMGHATAWRDEPLGGCQAIWIDDARGVLLGASDHRKDGMAIGY